MPPKTKVQLKAEIEQAKRELQEYRAGAEEQIRALQNAEAGLHTELEGLRELIQEFEREWRESARHLEDAQAEIKNYKVPPPPPPPDDSVADDVQVATVAAGDLDTEVLDESSELLELQLAELYYAAMIRFLQSETLPADK